MAKLKVIKKGPLAPEADYKGALSKVNEYSASGQHGTRERMAWTFKLLQRKEMKGDKPVFIDVPDENLEAFRATGNQFGSKNADVTKMLKALLPFGLSDIFTDKLEADTDFLTGDVKNEKSPFFGLGPLTADLRIEHSIDGDDTYANITSYVTEDIWLAAFRSRCIQAGYLE